MSVENVMEFLEVRKTTMTVTEAKDWLTDTWTIPFFISGIPLSDGWICFLCQYSCIEKSSMRSHCSLEHKGLNIFSQSMSCKVQKIFKGQLAKCLQILESLEELQEEDWKKTLNLEFQSTLTSQVQRDTQEEERGFNPRLVNAFYARIRWDLTVKDVERIELAEMTRIPVHGSKLYKIVLAGRRYIGNVCKELQGGNMLLRRSLMNSGYISLKGLSNSFRNESGRDSFSALQDKSSEDAYGTALGLLVCFYLRFLKEKESGEKELLLRWFDQYSLITSQTEKLQSFETILEMEDDSDILDKELHEVLMELFCWIESRNYISELACPVQRFLVAVCLQKDGMGFINVRDVTPWISKLEYGIRCTVWTELQRRIQEEGIEVGQDLGGMRSFIKVGNQTSFGFLEEIKHLAVTIAGTTNALPQVFLFHLLSDSRLPGLARMITWLWLFM